MLVPSKHVPLRRVLLQSDGALNTSQLQRWATHHQGTLSLHVGVAIPTDCGTVRVVACQPCVSGFLHAQTRLLLAPARAQAAGCAAAPTAAQLVQLAGFVCRLLVPTAAGPLLLALVALWSVRRRLSNRRLPLRAVSGEWLARLSRGAACDADAALLVCSRLLRRLGVGDGQWRRCLLQLPGHRQRRLLLQLVSVPRHEDVAFVSNALWWNLGLDEDARVVVHIPATECAVPRAKTARLAQVAGPAQLSVDLCQPTLQDHFRLPRMLAPGRLLSVRYERADNGRLCTAWFRVESVEPVPSDGSADPAAGLLADATTTSLFQVSDVVMGVPASRPLSDTVDEPGMVPTCLERYVRQLFSLLTAAERAEDGRRPLILVSGPGGSAAWRVVAAAAAALSRHLVRLEAGALTADSSGAAARRVQQALADRGQWHCLLQLCDAQLLCRDRETAAADRRVLAALLDAVAALPHTATLLLTAPTHEQVLPELLAHVTHHVTVSMPDEKARADVLGWSCRRHSVDLSWCSVEQIARRTVGFSLDDIEMLVAQAKYSALEQLEEWCADCGADPPTCIPQLCLDMDHVGVGLSFVRRRQDEVAGAPQVADTRWQDVGGLADVRQEIVNLVELPLAHPHLFAGTAARSGILLYGPPGTGKTLVAKAVATECGLSFISVKGPELINMYVGQSEANVRDVFSRAREAAPCVIFFDELDSLAPRRGRTGDSGGVMDRVVSQFLAELDGAASGGRVFVMAATNRPDLIDSALLRPGRFDRLLYLGPSRSRASHLAILRAQTRRLQLADDVELAEVAAALPEVVTGADAYAVCERAVGAALDRAVALVSAGEETEESAPVLVRQLDLVAAARSLVPSLSQQQIDEYESLKHSIQTSS